MRTFSFVLLFIVYFTNTYAQTLPNVQLVNTRAPANVKIDGKPTEWGNDIKGYNKSTSFYYHITNDDKNLYLIIQAIDNPVARKIIGGGISFTVYTSGKKNHKDAPRLTFPVFEEHAKQYIDFKKPELAGANPTDMYPDAMITANNKKLKGMAKTMSFKRGDNADTLISVYNNHGLQSAMLFDNKMVLTVEIAIDIKLLHASPDLIGKVLYHVESNAMDPINFNGYNIVYNADGTTKMQVTPGALTARDFEDGPHTTDFWGEYTLAK